MIFMQFDHIGVVTTEKKSDETFVPATRVWITEFQKHPFRVEWLLLRAGQPGDRTCADDAPRGLSR